MNRIYSVTDKEGIVRDTEEGIEQVFLGLYVELFGRKIEGKDYINSVIIRKGITVSREDRIWF